MHTQREQGRRKEGGGDKERDGREREREREIYTYQIFYLCYDIVTEIQLFQILS